MSQCSKLLWLGVIAMIISAFAPMISSAQVGWIHSTQRNVFSLEGWKASFTGETNYTFTTSVWFLSGYFPAGNSVAIVTELPFAHLGYKSIQSDYWGYYDVSSAENMIGNPYIGLEFARESGSTSIFKIGARLPIARVGNSYAGELGMVSAIDRFEAFTPNVLSLQVAGGYRYVSPGGLTLNGTIGPSLLLPSEQYLEPELWADFNGMMWLKAGIVNIGTGLSGRFLVAAHGASELSVGDRLIDQMVLAGNLDLGGFHPGVHFVVPLDKDLRSGLSLVYGVGLAYHL